MLVIYKYCYAEVKDYAGCQTLRCVARIFNISVVLSQRRHMLYCASHSASSLNISVIYKTMRKPQFLQVAVFFPNNCPTYFETSVY